MPAPARLAGVRTYVPPRKSNEPIVVASYELNPCEALVATLAERPDGRRTAALSRVKLAANGWHRSSVFEFGEHRAVAVASLVDELLRAIAARSTP